MTKGLGGEGARIIRVKGSNFDANGLAFNSIPKIKLYVEGSSRAQKETHESYARILC